MAFTLNSFFKPGSGGADLSSKIGSWKLDLAQHKLCWSDEIFQLLELDQATAIPGYEDFFDIIFPGGRTNFCPIIFV